MSIRCKCVLVLLQVAAVFWRQVDGSPSSNFTAMTTTTTSISITTPLPPLAASPSSADFVERFGNQLISGGRPFRFLGCNAYWLAEDALVPERRSRVDRAMDLAKGLGLRVLRLWAFSNRLPALGPAGSGLVWAEDEFVALDYVVRSAELYGLRLVLALGNFWPAYVAPEVFLRAANVTGGDLTVADFYSSLAAREMYKRHIAAVTSRVNVFSGVSYRDSPNIMMWDVINEPRCPGCSSSELSAFQDWMYDMASYTKAAAPRQLVSMGTEGFFGREPYGNLPSYVSFNPGAGSVCEGEDWIATSDVLPLDVAVVHTYWRQTEGVPSHDWTRMSFEEYLPWYMSYTWLHVMLAGALGKPLVQEEFNILSGKFTAVQRRQLFAVALAQLQASAASGGVYAGALWWSCALQGSHDDGYNVYIDVPRPPKRPLPLRVNILPPRPPPPQAAPQQSPQQQSPPPPPQSPPSPPRLPPPEQLTPPPPRSRVGPSIRYRRETERGEESEAQEQLEEDNTTAEAAAAAAAAATAMAATGGGVIRVTLDATSGKRRLLRGIRMKEGRRDILTSPPGGGINTVTTRAAAAAAAASTTAAAAGGDDDDDDVTLGRSDGNGSADWPAASELEMQTEWSSTLTHGSQQHTDGGSSTSSRTNRLDALTHGSLNCICDSDIEEGNGRRSSSYSGDGVNGGKKSECMRARGRRGCSGDGGGGSNDGGGGGSRAYLGFVGTGDGRNHRRSLLLDESLDPFRGGGPRAQCAEAAAARWRPALPPPLKPDFSNAATVATTGLGSTNVQQLLAAAAAPPPPAPSPSPSLPAAGVTASGRDLDGGVDEFQGDGELLNLIADAAAALDALSERPAG